MKYPPLKSLHLRLTSKCNMNCKYCYADAIENECSDNIFSEKIINKLIEESLKLGLEKVTLIGGEPTISDYFKYSLYKILNDTKDILIDIETNGLIILQYYEILKKNKSRIDVAISFDDKSIRGEKKYNKIISILDKLKNETDWVYVQSIITNDNVKNGDIFNMIDYINSLKLGHRLFPGPNKMGRGIDSDYLEWSNTERVIKYCEKNKIDNVRFELPDYMKSRQSKSCGWKNFRCEIMPNGNVTPCGPTAFNNPEFIAGNILNDSLSTIWKNSTFFQWLRNIKQNEFEGKCNTCKHWINCLGKCRSFAWSWGGSIYSEYPHCREFDKSSISIINDSVKPDTRYLF